MGNGKTLLMKRIAREMSRNTGKEKIFCMTMESSVEGYKQALDEYCEDMKYDNLTNLLSPEKIHNKVICFDETYLYFDGRNTASKENKLFGKFLDLAVRSNTDIIITAVKSKYLDKRLMRAAHFLISCKCYWNSRNFYFVLKHLEEEIDDMSDGFKIETKGEYIGILTPEDMLGEGKWKQPLSLDECETNHSLANLIKIIGG